MLAAMTTMGLAARDFGLAKVSANRFDRLAIQIAETVNTIARANGQSTEEFAEFTEAFGHRALRMHRVGACRRSMRRQGANLFVDCHDPEAADVTFA